VQTAAATNSPSNAIHLPNIHKQQPRIILEILQETMHP